jgi:hypothetical protein
MTRTRSLGSHRLRGCTDVLCIPSSALLGYDRHVTTCRQSRYPGSDLPGRGQTRGQREVACRPTLRNLKRSDEVSADRTAKLADHRSRCETPAGHRLATAGRPPPVAVGPGRADHRVTVGRSRRFFTVHGRLRTAIEASNAEPSHHHSFGRPRLAARCGEPLPFTCSIVRHKPATRAPLEPNKPHRCETQVTFSHTRPSCGSATAMKHPGDGNSLHSDNAMTNTAVRHIVQETSSLLVIARCPARSREDHHYAT